MSLTQRDYSMAYEAGKAARRGGKRITDCPFRNSKTASVMAKAEAWQRGFMDQHEEIGRAKA